MSPPEIIGLSNSVPAMEIKDKPIILFTRTVKDQSFYIKNIANIRMNLFKSFRCSFTVNVNRDDSLTVIFLDRNEACKAFSLNKISNIPVISEWWKPPLKSSKKIVLYNIPLELSTDDLKDGLMNNKGEMLEVLEVHRMGKLDSKGTRSSKSVLFILPASSQLESVFLFGQQKTHKIYQKKRLSNAQNVLSLVTYLSIVLLLNQGALIALVITPCLQKVDVLKFLNVQIVMVDINQQIIIHVLNMFNELKF